MILAPLGQLSPNYTIGFKLQDSLPCPSGVQRPPGHHPGSQLLLPFHFPKPRGAYPIFESLCFYVFVLLCYYVLSVISMSGRQRSWVASKHKLTISFWHATHCSKIRWLLRVTSLSWATVIPLLGGHIPGSSILAHQDSAHDSFFFQNFSRTTVPCPPVPLFASHSQQIGNFLRAEVELVISLVPS